MISAYLPHHVVAATRIGNSLGAFQILSEVPVDDKTIAILAWRQNHCRYPNSIESLLHWDGPLLPIRKVANQENALGTRFGKTEQLLSAKSCSCSHT